MKYLKEDPTGYNNQDPYAKTKGFHNGKKSQITVCLKERQCKM
jgi:hypothetical protein